MSPVTWLTESGLLDVGNSDHTLGSGQTHSVKQYLQQQPQRLQLRRILTLPLPRTAKYHLPDAALPDRIIPAVEKFTTESRLSKLSLQRNCLFPSQERFSVAMVGSPAWVKAISAPTSEILVVTPTAKVQHPVVLTAAG